MNSIDLLRDAFDRVAQDLPGVLEGLDAPALEWRPTQDANSIGWLVWHLARVQDNHLAELSRALFDDGRPELVQQGWHERLGLPYPVEAHGYGMSSADVDRFHVEDAMVLADYHAAVHQATLEVLDDIERAAEEQGGLDDLMDRIVDTRWDPPVSAGVRLVSVVNDTTQHLGQAAYIKGLLRAVDA